MILGIDLGTTKSVVGVYHQGKPYIIPDENGALSIPSLVLVTPDEKIFAGNIAKQHRDRYKGKNITISSVKRLIGKRGETSWSWWKSYPQEVSAFVLAELKYRAEKHLGQDISQAVIAIPSHFDASQRRATKEAAEIAGLQAVRLLNEATAAVVAYGFGKNKSGKVLVFDLGGGTLDVSVVDLGEVTYEVLCIEGDSELGGDDFDQLITDFVLEQVRSKYGNEMQFDPVQQLILKEAAELAKIELSSASTARVYVPGFIAVGNGRQDLDVFIERSVFENLSQGLLERAINLLKKALDSAGKIKPDSLAALLLLGGSSRIPRIRQRIASELHIEPFTGVDPETCVAEGAIIQAGVLSGAKDFEDILLLDATPSSYGIETMGGVMTRLIQKNTTVPTGKSKIYTTTEDQTTTILHLTVSITEVCDVKNKKKNSF